MKDIKGLDLYLSENQNVHFLEAEKKGDVIVELLSKIPKENFKDYEEVKREMLMREDLMSTGIGLGIAFPHIGSVNVEKMSICVGILKKGVDWGAIDDKPVRIVILIVYPSKRRTEYLTLISKLSTVLKEEMNREKIEKSSDSEEVFQILTNNLVI
ncbi:PTS sugar transporter subunit IIA [candidate division WOR-3 bacterium]|nr:PTS sugar transporter subunit IIA [candidate division WOR-3 bacterium]